MPDERKIVAAAAALRNANYGMPVAPLRDWLDSADAEMGYAVQAHNRDIWKSMGRDIVGYKVGMTAKAVQAMMGVDEPSFGTLHADMQVPDNGILRASRTISPRIEGEIALVLGRDLTNPDATEADIAAAVDRAHAAIEICDSRIADWQISFADSVADNGSAGFFVIANEGRPAGSVDLFSCGMVLEVDGAVATLGAGAAACGHPVRALAWLARKLTACGENLRAGDIILTGSLGAIVPIVPGNHVRVSIGGIGACTFDFRND